MAIPFMPLPAYQAPNSLDTSPITDMIQQGYAREQQAFRNKLAADAEKRTSELHPLQVQAQQRALAQQALTDPLAYRKLKTDVVQGEESADILRQFRQEQGFNVPNAAAKIPTPTTQAPVNRVDVARKVADFVDNYVIKAPDARAAQANWQAFQANPDFSPHLQKHAQNYGATGDWRVDAGNFVRDMRHEANGVQLKPMQQAPSFAVGEAPVASAQPQPNRPLYNNIGEQMAAAQRMAVVPGMSGVAEQKFKTFQGMLEKGYMPTAPGSRDQVMPISGTAETQARAEQMKQEAQKVGEGQGTAQVNLPTALNAGNTMIRNINAALESKALDQVVGVVAGHPYSPTIRQSSADAEALLKPLEGGIFMQAYQSLKGGGAISDVEGAKAAASISRLSDRRMSPEAYREALRETKVDIADLMALAQAKAAGQGAQEAARIGMLQEARAVIARNAKTNAADDQKAAALEAVRARLRQSGIDPLRL